MLEDRERFRWEEYEFEVFFAPGQTEFHSLLSVELDGRKVAFTGDNYFIGDVLVGTKLEARPYQTTVLRNSFQLHMHRRCAEVMRAVSPELICPGHHDVLACSKDQIDDYCDFIERKEKVFRELVNDPADHYIDLFWTRLVPYLATVKPDQKIEYRLLIRNNFERDVRYEARLNVPEGWTSSRELRGVEVCSAGRGEMRLETTAPASADGIRRIVTASLFIDGEPQGPIAEALVTVVE